MRGHDGVPLSRAPLGARDDHVHTSSPVEVKPVPRDAAGLRSRLRAAHGRVLALNPFPLPLHLVTGNHDTPEALVGGFGGTRFLGGGRLTSYVVEHAAFTVVVLDSWVSGSPGGGLGSGQVAWLERALAERPGAPALVCLHHPPVPVGIPFLDAMGLADGPALAAVVAAHPRVVRVLAGHVHRPVTAPFAGSTVAVAPSTYRQSGLVLREGVPGYPDEPPAFLLHVRPGAPAGAAWVTHTVPTSAPGVSRRVRSARPSC
ncbi:metallophosphoesterase [Streptomyces rubiginosohelvolus]|uniref:metallophosphoesterase n=1 Tax=Streptomyces rubiginosohelvolus TaxID=67362 RepID=UPI0036DD6E31